MTISTVTGPTGAPAASGLNMQDFLKVLLTQLTYQDPLKPMDNEQFMAQIAQFTTLQQTQQMNSNIEQLLTNQASLQSVGLIGRTVDLQTASGAVTGTVTALSFANGSPQLTVKTTSGSTLANVGLNQITTVH